MNNENTVNNAADGAEAQNTAVAAPISESSPSGQPLKNGVQRHQGGLRNFRDESTDKDVWVFLKFKYRLKLKNSQLSNQSVREPMMSMVAEENANTPQTPAAGNGNASNQSPDSKEQKSQPAKQLPKLSRAAQSIQQMRTVGAVVKQVTGARRYDLGS